MVLPDSTASFAGGPRLGAGKHIVLACYGSFGDLHPYIALGLGLQARGHRAVIATSAHYREKVEQEGLGFHAIRPEMPPMEQAPQMMRRGMDARTGSEYVVRTLIMPHLRGQYEDVAAAAHGADLLVCHPITFGVPLVAEKLGIPWVGTTLAPMHLLSSYDPPVPPGAYRPHPATRFSPAFTRFVFSFARKQVRAWGAEAETFRAELGLPPGPHPVFEAVFSPLSNLALFSPVLGQPQVDWPVRTRATGFLFYDRQLPGRGLPSELEAFLAAGPPPLVFTLGSAAVIVGGDFFVQAAAAAQALGQRAVLLVGKEGWNEVPARLPGSILACEYAPHSELFPRASVVIHQGGVGTTAQGLRAGRPTLVVPFAHDQPDNAWRVRKLGVSRTLPRSRFTAAAAARELRLLLEQGLYTRHAAEVADRIRRENGIRTACDAIEEALRHSRA